MQHDRDRDCEGAEQEERDTGNSTTSSWTSPTGMSATRSRAAATYPAARSRSPRPAARGRIAASALPARAGMPCAPCAGSATTSCAVSRSLNFDAPRNGNVNSFGSSTWKTTTSVPRKRRCFSPLITGSGSSSRSEIRTTRLRLSSASASWCSGRATSDRCPGCSRSSASSSACRWPGRAAAGSRNADLFVERDQPRRVALTVHQERERARQHRSVFELAHRRRAPVRHRGALIEQQVAFEVRLFLELLDVVPVRARVDLPVERGQVVARAGTAGTRRTRR